MFLRFVLPWFRCIIGGTVGIIADGAPFFFCMVSEMLLCKNLVTYIFFVLFFFYLLRFWSDSRTAILISHRSHFGSRYTIETCTMRSHFVVILLRLVCMRLGSDI